MGYFFLHLDPAGQDLISLSHRDLVTDREGHWELAVPHLLPSLGVAPQVRPGFVPRAENMRDLEPSLKVGRRIHV